MPIKVGPSAGFMSRNPQQRQKSPGLGQGQRTRIGAPGGMRRPPNPSPVGPPIMGGPPTNGSMPPGMGASPGGGIIRPMPVPFPGSGAMPPGMGMPGGGMERTMPVPFTPPPDQLEQPMMPMPDPTNGGSPMMKAFLPGGASPGMNIGGMPNANIPGLRRYF